MELRYPISAPRWVTQIFGVNPQWYPKTNGHNGIDYGIVIGTPIYAAAAGTVVLVREDPGGYGKHVRIDHGMEGGYSHLTIYGHMSEPKVALGQYVEAGQLIGLSGNTGWSTGPHLHFEYRRGGAAVDPQPYLVEEVTPIVVVPAPESFPVLPKIRVICNSLNIRNTPAVTGGVVGGARRSEELGVLGLVTVSDGEQWAQVGFKQYVAIKFGGKSLATWVG